MKHSLLPVLTVLCLGVPQLVPGDEMDCGFFNEIIISDPVGDLSPGSSPCIDITSVRIRQVGDGVLLELHSNCTTYPDAIADAGFSFDMDGDPDTGFPFGSIGLELQIYVGEYLRPYSVFSYADADGNWITETTGPQVHYLDDGFSLLVPMEEFPTVQPTLYVTLTGNDPSEGDEVDPAEITFQPSRAPNRLLVDSDHRVPVESPTVISIPTKAQGVQLNASLIGEGGQTSLAAGDISYTTSHPREDFGNDPDNIVSIDSAGVAHYVGEGFVYAAPYFEACGLTGEEFILATGDVFTHPQLDRVVAVFPTDWAPPGSAHTFGSMMDTYSGYMQLVNHGYLIQTELYRGFQPFDGASQIFALVVEDGLCGSNGNPLLTAPGCYMVSGDGSPQYDVVIHEMGHNFSLEASAMDALLFADQGRIAWSGFIESVASLPIIYFEQEVVGNGSRYGIAPGSFEEQYFQGSIDMYCPDSRIQLEEFEADVSLGLVDGIFDSANVGNSVGVMCSFFQAFACDWVDGPNPYRHHVIRRFLNVFSGEPIPGFQEDKVDTYFGAAYSAAAGRDMRDKLELWGFEIDDPFYDQIMPMIESRIELFSDRFEFGDLNKWSIVRP
jgi:hypothetical protein